MWMSATLILFTDIQRTYTYTDTLNFKYENIFRYIFVWYIASNLLPASCLSQNMVQVKAAVKKTWILNCSKIVRILSVAVALLSRKPSTPVLPTFSSCPSFLPFVLQCTQSGHDCMTSLPQFLCWAPHWLLCDEPQTLWIHLRDKRLTLYKWRMIQKRILCFDLAPVPKTAHMDAWGYTNRNLKIHQKKIKSSDPMHCS